MEFVLSDKEREKLSELFSKELDSVMQNAQRKTGPLKKEEKSLLSVKEAAELLHVTPTTIHIWKAKGKISFLKIGRRTLFLKDDLYKSLTVVKMPSQNKIK